MAEDQWYAGAVDDLSNEEREAVKARIIDVIRVMYPELPDDKMPAAVETILEVMNNSETDRESHDAVAAFFRSIDRKH